MLLWVYYGLPISTGLDLGIMSAAIISLALTDSAFEAEIFRAGIKSKDQIVRINDESTVGMDINQAVNRMRGAAGTDILIYVMRKGWVKSKPFKLTRAIIKMKSVSSKVLDDNIGYLKIKGFQGNTASDVKSHLTALVKKSKGLKGLIIDFRNNLCIFLFSRSNHNCRNEK